MERRRRRQIEIHVRCRTTAEAADGSHRAPAAGTGHTGRNLVTGDLSVVPTDLVNDTATGAEADALRAGNARKIDASGRGRKNDAGCRVAGGPFRSRRRCSSTELPVMRSPPAVIVHAIPAVTANDV